MRLVQWTSPFIQVAATKGTPTLLAELNYCAAVAPNL
jgi:hypothetical protein